MIDVRIQSGKALAALVGVVALMASSATIVLAGSTVFSDVPNGSFFEESIYEIVGAGCAGGFNDNTFRPADSATRGQFALWGSNCFSSSARASGPNVPALSTSYQDIDNPTITIAGFANERQYLHVNAWFTLNDEGSECPCDVNLRVQLVENGIITITDTSQEIVKVVERGSGGDIDDTVLGSFRFQVNTGAEYEVQVQGRVFGSTNSCLSQCLALQSSEVLAWTVPLQASSSGEEAGTESAPTPEQAESVNNAVLAPTGQPDK